MSLNGIDWKLLVVLACVVLAIMVLRRTSFVSAEKARQLLSKGALIIDVRSPGEFNSGHLQDAVNIPLGNLSSDLPQKIPEKNRILLLHCLSGGRSGIAQQQLKRMGYANAFNLGSYRRAASIVQEAQGSAPKS